MKTKCQGTRGTDTQRGGSMSAASCRSAGTVPQRREGQRRGSLKSGHDIFSTPLIKADPKHEPRHTPRPCSCPRSSQRYTWASARAKRVAREAM